jgi:hypothetical protein
MINNSVEPQNNNLNEHKSLENSLASNQTSKTMKMSTEPGKNYDEYKSRKYRNYPKKMDEIIQT